MHPHWVVSVFPVRELSLHLHPVSTRLEKGVQGRASQHCWYQQAKGKPDAYTHPAAMTLTDEVQSWANLISTLLSPYPDVSRAQWGAESPSTYDAEKHGGRQGWLVHHLTSPHPWCHQGSAEFLTHTVTAAW